MDDRKEVLTFSYQDNHTLIEKKKKKFIMFVFIPAIHNACSLET